MYRRILIPIDGGRREYALKPVGKASAPTEGR